VKAVPPVIMVDMDPSLPVDPFEVRDATINQSPYVAMARAKSVVSSRDMDDYATAHTEDVHYLLVHSLMRVGFLAFVFLGFPCVLSFFFFFCS
jgi:hypothetical protein